MRQMQKSHGGHGPAQAESMLPARPVDSAYTEETIASLRYMIEEEKMAGDLYDAFYAQTGLIVFSKIGTSEDRHMDALLKQASRAGVDVGDLLALPAGEYSDLALQALYAQLLDQGSVSSTAALAVGQQVELTDIADLNGAIVDGANTALVGVYSKLLAGSENHLAAFDYYLG